MSNINEAVLNFNDDKTLKLVEVLFHAEKAMPGVWRLLKSIKESNGTLEVDIYNERFNEEILDVFENAWGKVNGTHNVEVGWTKSI